ncbi:MAG: proline--tRNA ligase [Acidilobaceae archaeon]
MNLESGRQPSRVQWSNNFSRWFEDFIEKAEVYDYGRYPVKGMGVWLPYGFQLRRRVLDLLRSLLDETGHEEVLFPLLIPEELLKKETEHIRGFENEVYWVTHGGLEPLDVKLALRPTSETTITYFESLWIKSYKQLPKKYYQIVSVFRYETKATKPMIRLREVTTFKEAHTVHHSFEDSEKQILEAVEIYKKFFDRLGIPYAISRRPEWDKFAGALYTIAFDTIMPDGKVLQIGTVHNLGQNFTKAFGFRIQLADGTLDYPWQTSYGVSDRVIATLISINGDDRGLVLPPEVAPIQVVIIPIPSSSPEENAKISQIVKKIADELKREGVRVHIDDREDLRPGAKYYYWEAKGVPLRIDVGAEEYRAEALTIVRRDTLTKTRVPFEEVVTVVKKLLDSTTEYLKKRNWEFFKSRTYSVDNVEEATTVLKENGGIVEVPWCGLESCAKKLEELIEARCLGTPWPRREADGYCLVCSRRAVAQLRYAKTY